MRERGAPFYPLCHAVVLRVDFLRFKPKFPLGAFFVWRLVILFGLALFSRLTAFFGAAFFYVAFPACFWRLFCGRRARQKEKDGVNRLFLRFIIERRIAIRAYPVRSLGAMRADVRAAVGADHCVFAFRAAIFTSHDRSSLFQYAHNLRVYALSLFIEKMRNNKKVFPLKL